MKTSNLLKWDDMGDSVSFSDLLDLLGLEDEG